MPTAPAPIDRDALRAKLETARGDLMSALHAKQEADRRYMEAFVAYERMAEQLRQRLIAEGANRKPVA